MEKNRGQAYSLILGQCTQLLQDNKKQDTAWNATRTSYEPLVLLQLMEKTILAQTEYQYPFATIYDQELNFYTFHSGPMTNTHWYEHLNTKVDVFESIGVTRKHKELLEYVVQESH